MQEINKLAPTFSAAKLNMSVFEMIRNRDIVLMRVIQHQIATTCMGKEGKEGKEGKGMAEGLEGVVTESKRFMAELGGIRTSIYGSFQDNDILFMYLVTLLVNVEMVPYVAKIIQENSTESSLLFGISQIESVVYYCYRRKTTETPLYINNEGYLLKIIELLP